MRGQCGVEGRLPSPGRRCFGLSAGPVLCSFWIPQIVHCVRADVRQPLRPLYVLGISATRLALPLYLFGCPKNMLRIEESPYLCAALVAWVMLQAGVLMLQAHFGPRCFIPKRFLPPKYDYFQEAKPFQVRGALTVLPHLMLQCDIYPASSC